MEEENRNLGQAAVVAHQMQSPVGTLHTILRALLGGVAGELSEKQKKMLRSADVKCSEAMETIRSLLSLTEAERYRPGQATADILSAAREVHERYRPAAAQKDIQLTLDVQTREAYVPGDLPLIRETIATLVDNALKYTPQGGRVVLRLEADSKTGNVLLKVSDSGIGIPDGERDGLFQPFFRASNARRLMREGTGLGLSFVRAIVRAAGGSISAGQSDLGGAEFTMELPKAPAPSPQGARAQAVPAFRVVVIGGVAAGPKVAAKVMRLRPDAGVTIVERGQVLSYAGCGLPYYIAGVVKDQRELVSTPEGVVRGPEYFETVKNVRVMNRTEALKIDRTNRQVLVSDLISGRQGWLHYDKLAVCTGAVPTVPSIPGVHCENVFTLHGVQHAEGIKASLAEARAKDVTIVGAGLIGVEMTESLVMAGCRVTLVEMLPQVLPKILDPEMAQLVTRHFESRGVRVMLNTRVVRFDGNGKVRRVVTDGGSFPADMVIVGVGVRPNVELAAEAGLELGPTGGIKVDEHMRTSDPDIYAAGDCVECTDLITGRPCYVPLGSTANKQGRVAAVNVCGGSAAFPGVLGTTVCKVFGYTVARTGLLERQAVESGYNTVTTLTPGLDRAHFMPDAGMIIVKLIADGDARKLLGMQAIGPGEAAKRVDVAATAITAGMTLDQISALDLCYAPSYSDALDNIHTACNVMKNKLDGHMAGIPPVEVRRRLEAGERIVLLDVRTHAEFDDARIDGSTHIPLGALRGRLGELPRDREIITFSRVSLSAYEAAIILKANGFGNVKVMDGGILMWPQGKAGGQAAD